VTRKFIANETHNQISAKKIKISKIFDWYGDDFKKGDNTVISFINQYSKLTVNADAKIEFLEYNWKLNE
jgi:hypothetical protein